MLWTYMVNIINRLLAYWGGGSGGTIDFIPGRKKVGGAFTSMISNEKKNTTWTLNILILRILS